MTAPTIVDVSGLLGDRDPVMVEMLTETQRRAWLVADPRRLRLARRIAYLDVRLRELYRTVAVNGPAPECVLDEIDAAVGLLEDAFRVARFTLDAPHVAARSRGCAA